MIYLDNAATTFPKPECVYVAMDKMNRYGAVNAGRGSYHLAQEASMLIEETKNLLRKLVHVDSSVAVVFAPSITIALNQIINGLEIRDRAVVYVSPYEHNAVARSVHELSKKKELLVKELPLKSNLEIDLEKMKYEFALDNPEVVFCTHISNVTGYILPVEDIFKESKKYGCINILDSAQSLGLIDVRADTLDVDLLAFAGHKTLYGPLGIGGFMNVTDCPMETFISGGTGSDSLSLDMPSGKESRYEAASSNIIAVVGLNAALKNLNIDHCFQHEKKIVDYFLEKVSDIGEIKVFLPDDLTHHIGIISFVLQGFNSNDVGVILDEDFDIAVRTGYHCAPYVHKYLRDKEYMGTIRIGVGQFTTQDDIDKIVQALKEIIYG